MKYNDLLARLIYLTKRNNISNAEIGAAINLERRAVNGRAERNSRFKPEEIEAVEKYYNVDLSSIEIVEKGRNISAETESAETLNQKALKFTRRISKLQSETGLSDKDFAGMLGLDKEEYLEYKKGERKPNLSIIIALKQHFPVTADWLLFGG